MARSTASRSRNASPAPRAGRNAQRNASGSQKASGSRGNRRDAEDDEEEDIELDDVDASQDGQNVRSQVLSLYFDDLDGGHLAYIDSHCFFKFGE